MDKFINTATFTKLIGLTSVKKAAKKLGIKDDSILVLDRGEGLELDNLKVSAVFADHGEYAPDCIGVIIEVSGKRIYFISDCSYRPDLPNFVDLEGAVDLLMVPINGKFGNPDPRDASYITAWVKPKKVIPCHFWIFVEHGGDPGLFVEYCREISPDAKVIIPAISEKIGI